MATYTVIKKSGERFRVTTDDSKRTQIRTGKGFSTGGDPTVIRKSTGRIDETATVQKIEEERKATQEVDLKASEPQPAEQPKPLEPEPNEYVQTYQYVSDGGVNQGTQERQQEIYYGQPPPKVYGANELAFQPSAKNFFTEFRPNYPAYVEELSKNLEEQRKEAVKEEDYGKAILLGTTNIGVGFVKGIAQFTRPEDIIKGTVQAIENPSETGKALGEQLRENPTTTLGEFAGFEFTVLKTGKFAITAKDYARTAKRGEIPYEFITSPEIRTGETDFPVTRASPEQLSREFKGGSRYVANAEDIFNPESAYYKEVVKSTPELTTTEQVISYTERLGKELIKETKDKKALGFSASKEPLSDNIIKTRSELGDFTSASSGLYVAPEVSEYFFGIKKQPYTSYNIEFGLNTGGRPTLTIPRVDTKNVLTFPKSEVAKAQSLGSKKASIEYLNKYAKENFPEGSIYTSPEFALKYKTEAENIFKAGTVFQEVKTPITDYFTRVGERRVKITPIEPVKITEGQPTPPGAKTFEEFIKQNQEAYSSISSQKQQSGGLLTLTAPSLSPSSSKVVTTTGNYPTGVLSSITSTTPFNPGYKVIYEPIDVNTYSSLDFGRAVRTTPKYSAEITAYDYLTPSREGSSRRGGGSSIISPIPSEPPLTPPSDTGGGGSSRIIPPPRRTPPRVPYYPVIPPRRSIITPPPRSKTYGTSAFDVLVKKGGVFRKVNPFPLTRQSAIDFGTFRVGATSSATFKLKSVFGKPRTQSLRGNIRDFYRKGDLFIEKKERRIKRGSPGELKEITFKGIATRKGKKKAKPKKIKNIFGRSVKWA